MTQMLEDVPESKESSRLLGLRRGRKLEVEEHGFRLERGRVVLDEPTAAAGDPAHDPDVVLKVFAAMARTGATLGREAEERLSEALPLLSAQLEEGPALWHRLQEILHGHDMRAVRCGRCMRWACWSC